MDMQRGRPFDVIERRQPSLNQGRIILLNPLSLWYIVVEVLTN